MRTEPGLSDIGAAVPYVTGSIGPVTQARPSHVTADNIEHVSSVGLLLFHVSTASCLSSRAPRRISAERRRCDRRWVSARSVTRRELVTKIDASTNNPEGNWASSRIDDTGRARPAPAQCFIFFARRSPKRKQLIYYGPRP